MNFVTTYSVSIDIKTLEDALEPEVRAKLCKALHVDSLALACVQTGYTSDGITFYTMVQGESCTACDCGNRRDVEEVSKQDSR